MSQLQTERLLLEEASYMRTILGQARGEMCDFEKDAMPLARELIPTGPAVLRQVMIRLIALHVADANALMRYIVPRHIEIMQNYGYSPETDKARAEGTSDFWLFRANNQALQMMEHLFGAGISATLHPNVHSVYVVRSFLRIQALFMDIDQVGKIIKIHDLYRQNIPEDLLPLTDCGRIDVENFEPVSASIDDDTIAGMPFRHLDA